MGYRSASSNSFIDSISVKSGLIALLAILALGGCIGTTYPYMRTETAQRIASPAWMIKRDIAASPFMLRSYERIHNRGGNAHIYIEGENTGLSSGATPAHPVALHLASKDKVKNVIYIARPCQYTGMLSTTEECDASYWNENSFSQEVINAYNKALDNIAARYDIQGFELIGYSGGGTISALLASTRQDVISLRTVSGILDHEAYTSATHKAPFSGSLNPANQTLALSNMPQYHFIGGGDNEVPPSVLHSYMQSMPPSRCVQTMLIQGASHEAGWVDKWPELLELPVSCYTRHTSDINIEVPKIPTQSTPYTVREKPVKP